MVKEQVKIAPSGKVYGLDIGGISTYLYHTGYEDEELEMMLKKLKIVFEELYGKEN